METSKYPTVYVAIPTGAIKEYALLYMFAALKNLDYPADKLSLNFAITHRGTAKDDLYIKHIKQLVEASDIQYPFSLTVTYPSHEEQERWGQYYAVICNVHELRKKFLDGTADLFWVIGGDNPPPRHMLKGLLRFEADVRSPMIRQRPNRARDFDKPGMPLQSDPRAMFWMYLWHLDDVRKRKDLDPRVKEALRSCWLNLPLLVLIKTDKQVLAHRVSFGSGCSLVTRKVMEHIGYYLSDSAYCSEDLAFMQWAHTLGFTTALNTGLQCLHFDPDGRLY
jgi:hypothetical protein